MKKNYRKPPPSNIAAQDPVVEMFSFGAEETLDRVSIMQLLEAQRETLASSP